MIGRLNHVAIAVPDLAAAVRIYADGLGAVVSEPLALPEHGVTVVFVALPNGKVELMAPLGATSPIASFLERNPQGGLHHVCYEVEDLAAARDRLTDGGAAGARVGRAADRCSWQAGSVPAPEGSAGHARGIGRGLTGHAVRSCVAWLDSLLNLAQTHSYTNDCAAHGAGPTEAVHGV